jgi:hypothetical protein
MDKPQSRKRISEKRGALLAPPFPLMVYDLSAYTCGLKLFCPK